MCIMFVVIALVCIYFRYTYVLTKCLQANIPMKSELYVILDEKMFPNCLQKPPVMCTVCHQLINEALQGATCSPVLLKYIDSPLLLKNQIYIGSKGREFEPHRRHCKIMVHVHIVI